MVTTGLSAFVDREIEFQPSAKPPDLLASRLIGTIRYLLAKGPVLNDGDTLGISENERIRVRLVASEIRPEQPVYALSLEQVDDAAL